MITNFIDGREIPPVMGEASSELDVVQAIRSAHAAGDRWAESTREERARILTRFADRLDAAAGTLAASEAAETGVSLELARRDVERALTEFRAHVRETPADDRPTAESAPIPVGVPVGVVAVITARCFVARSLLPRLGALLVKGNAVIVKPSSRGGAVIRELGRLATTAELPAGVCNIVFGRGAQLGRFLAEHPGVPGVVLFGRTETGRAVMSAGAAHLKRLSLHLGAKNAALVLKDASLENLGERLARAAFARAGVDPFALSKILIAQEIFDEVVGRLREAAPANLRLDADDRERLAASVALARRENGRVHGGEVAGDLVTPALVTDLTHCSEIHQDELLAPLVTLNPIKYPHEGVKWANTSPYGRAAAVFTQKLELGHKLARQLDVGTVWINGWFDDAPSAALGADHKLSGLGDFGASGSLPRVVVE